ncbi:transposase [Limosilactobacillus rudii]|uniref:transposase n=1 Tax=Limosilactobacillus rudii TaxID=2759755 RepID=UPI0035C015C8
MSGRTSNHSLEQRLEAVHKALSGEYSINELANQYHIYGITISRWVRKYKNNGIDGLKESHHWKRYSVELKLKAVDDYLNNHLPAEACCEKYNISSSSVLARWISRYTSGKTLTTTGGRPTMKRKSQKKFSYDERLKIVHDTISHDKDYQMAIKKYGVSYNQIYSWVRKYEAQGQSGLEDRRGQRIKDQPNRKLTYEEKLELEIAALKKRNTDLEAENFFLKKLRALRKLEK